jgi:hypothetical protein
MSLFATNVNVFFCLLPTQNVIDTFPKRRNLVG